MPLPGAHDVDASRPQKRLGPECLGMPSAPARGCSMLLKNPPFTRRLRHRSSSSLSPPVRCSSATLMSFSTKR